MINLLIIDDIKVLQDYLITFTPYLIDNNLLMRSLLHISSVTNKIHSNTQHLLNVNLTLIKNVD